MYRSRMITVVAVSFTFMLLFSGPPLPDNAGPGKARAQSPREARAIEILAQRLGVPPSELEVVSEVELEPEDIARIKVVLKSKGETHVVNLDEKYQEVSDRRMQEILIAHRGRGFRGKQELDLVERIDKGGPTEFTTVGIWLNTPGPPPRINRKDEELGRAGSQIAKMKEFIRGAQKGILEFLRTQDAIVEYASENAPYIIATLPNRLIPILEKRGDVEALYLAREHKAELDTSTRTVNADDVWARGITGSGIKVAVVEDDGIAFAHSSLADGTYCNPGTPNIGDHATHVAGIIASTSSTYRGVAYGAPALLSGNSLSYSTNSLITCTEWAINNGARVINYSFGVDSSASLTDMDRYVDYVVRYRAVTMIKSAGNIGYTCFDPPYISSPGKGWNIITVGNFSDNNTGGSPPNWGDDSMSGSSCYEDPSSTHGDREKPEVAAPGTSIMSTLAGGGFGTMSGTSMAAPHAVGCAALLMQRNSAYKYWPESIKAILMASAIHNIEGATRLSEKDGGGGLECVAADDVVRLGWESHGSFSSADFPKTFTFNANANQKVRVVIVWDSTTDTVLPPTSDVLKADFDLYIYKPDGTYLTGSASWDNSYEIVEFTAPATGTYSAKVYAYRFDGSSEYLAFAYHKR